MNMNALNSVNLTLNKYAPLKYCKQSIGAESRNNNSNKKDQQKSTGDQKQKTKKKQSKEE